MLLCLAGLVWAYGLYGWFALWVVGSRVLSYIRIDLRPSSLRGSVETLLKSPSLAFTWPNSPWIAPESFSSFLLSRWSRLSCVTGESSAPGATFAGFIFSPISRLYSVTSSIEKLWLRRLGQVDHDSHVSFVQICVSILARGRPKAECTKRLREP